MKAVKVGPMLTDGLTTTQEQVGYSNLVDADWDAVRDLEIVAAPTFIVGEERLVGAQSYENLIELVVKTAPGKR